MVEFNFEKLLVFRLKTLKFALKSSRQLRASLREAFTEEVSVNHFVLSDTDETTEMRRVKSKVIFIKNTMCNSPITAELNFWEMVDSYLFLI